MVCSALRVRAASEVVRRECAWAGRPICLRLYSSVFGMALNGPLVRSWSALCSCLRVSASGAVKDAFQASIGRRVDCTEEWKGISRGRESGYGKQKRGFFKWSGELNGVSARADVHPEVQDGICEGGGGKLWYVFGEVAVELALSFWCGAENLCFESVDVEVASMRDDEENGVGGAEGENEVARGDADIVAIGTGDSIVRGDFEGDETNDRIKSEGEESHGEWTALLDTRGEEDAEAERVVDEDGVAVIVVEALDGANEVVWEAHEVEEEEDVRARD